MKTLTEFSTLTLRKAAAARAAVGGARTPQAAAPVAPVPEAVPPTDVEVAPAGDTPADEPSETAAASDAAVSEGAPATPPDPAIDAVATALSVQPDRAARLLEALDIVGNAIEQVRLVRVYQGETGPTGAVSRGEFHYVIDRVAGASRGRSDDRRDDRGGRGGRGGGDRGGGGGSRGGGGGGPGGDRRDKPRGLGSLKAGAKVEHKDDDRPARGEMPHAGIGWQLTAAPRDFKGPGRGGPKRGPGRGRGPGGPGGDDRRGPRVEERGGPRRDGAGPGGGRGPGGGAGRGPGGGDRGPRRDFAPRDARPADGQPAQPQGPRLGPDGQPLPPRSKRPRKPIGPDENGMGPDGKPWDPTRRAKRETERGVGVNSQPPANVEAQVPSVSTETASESPSE